MQKNILKEKLSLEEWLEVFRSQCLTHDNGIPYDWYLRTLYGTHPV